MNRREILQRLEERANARHADNWLDTVDIGQLLGDLPARSPERKRLMAEITERTRRKPATIRQCLVIYKACVDNDGEVFLPTRIAWSSALHMAQKGCTRDDFIHANDEGMTLEQIRAWLIDRETVREKKEATFWRVLTKTVDADIRKATEPLTGEQVTRLKTLALQVARDFGK